MRIPEQNGKRRRAMPRFYFHVWQGGQLTPDGSGVALPTLDAARRRAEGIAWSIFGESRPAPDMVSGWDIEVVDDAGRTVLLLSVSDAEATTSATCVA